MENKPLKEMTNKELTYYRVFLEVGDGDTGGCQDWQKWQALAEEFRKRSMILNAAKCEGRAWYYRTQAEMEKAE